MKNLNVIKNITYIFLCLTLFIFLYGFVSYKNKNFISKDVNNTYQEKPKKLLFIGDVMLGRYVETLMKENGNDYPFTEVSELLKSHTAVANLEGPIPKIHEQTPISGFTFSFRSKTGDILSSVGIKAVSLANNHSFDKGLDGYENTKKVLNESEVSHFGSYKTTTEDYFETSLNNVPVVVFGINMISDTWNEKEALRVAKLLRSEHLGAILVAYIHWGNEYDHKQGSVQIELAHKLVDSGVDVIIGAHPHVTQGIEKYKNSIIFYSLGNFVFDQYFSKDVQEFFGVTFDIEENKKVFTIVPFVSNRSKVSVATSTNESKILSIISENSSSELMYSIKSKKIILP